ncbi:MAG: chemotaxis protein CheW [Gemmatimonadaceae bacterium]
MSTTSIESPPPVDGKLHGILVVEADGLLYGIDGESVREIVSPAPTMRVPGAPPFVRGIMNIRGAMVTVVDLPQRLSGAALQETTASIVVIEGGGRLLGVAVDDVLDVQSRPSNGLEPAPLSVAGALACGLGHFGDRVVIVIDVNELVRQVLA